MTPPPPHPLANMSLKSRLRNGHHHVVTTDKEMTNCHHLPYNNPMAVSLSPGTSPPQHPDLATWTELPDNRPPDTEEPIHPWCAIDPHPAHAELHNW
jgi:hypothetical protein